MRTNTILTAVTGAVLVAMLAACGGNASSSESSAAVAASPTAVGDVGGAADFTAYRECMAQNGVTLPDMGQPPAGGAMPTGAPPTAAANGQGGVPLPDGVDQSTFDAAQTACSSLRPAMGLGGGTPPTLDRTALAAFASCLGDHDVTVGSGDDWMTQLDRTDATVKAAMDTCSPLLPQPSPSQ